MSDYVTLLMDYAKDYESPNSFWRWSAYSTVSSILRFNVYLQHKAGKIYPNTYTILLADSARYRKGMSLSIVNELVAEVNNTKVFNGTASVQGILDKLSQDIPIKGKGLSIKGGGCLILAEELASFFVDDPRLLPLLTNMYDYKPEFPYDLRGASFTIKNLCVTLLGASNEIFLREVYTTKAVYGGLLRRTLLVKPDSTRNPNSLFDPDKLVDPIMAANQKAELIRILLEISKMSGPVTMTYMAAKIYDAWYKELYPNYDKFGGRTGFVEGIHTLILKIALAKAAARGVMTINDQIIEEAILEVTALKPNYEVYSMQAGGSDDAKKATIVIHAIWKAPGCCARKQDILMKYWNDLSADDFERVIRTFIEGGLVTITPNGTNPTYTLTKECIEKLESKMNKP